LATEWVEGSVKEYGDTQKEKQQSIREKLPRYKLSTAHIKECEIASLNKKETMETFNIKLQAKQYTTTCRIFQSAYQIAKLNRPMTDLPALTSFREANGLEMGYSLQSNHACTGICHLIASEMRKNLVKYITENDLEVGFMIDEFTTIIKKRGSGNRFTL
jgi:hypothetical protein